MMTGWEEPTEEEMAARKARWEREEREPTPLPWRVVRGLQWNDKDELVSIEGANEDTVADNMEYYPHAIKAADAEFIVQRVNAHDALVAALEAVQKGVPDVLRCECLNQIVEDALALARGGK